MKQTSHHDELRWSEQLANLDELRAVREQRRRHDLVMAHMRFITQAVEPAPSNHWVARTWRAVTRWL